MIRCIISSILYRRLNFIFGFFSGKVEDQAGERTSDAREASTASRADVGQVRTTFLF
jgi:hypothetical protein